MNKVKKLRKYPDTASFIYCHAFINQLITTFIGKFVFAYKYPDDEKH